jgi:dolichol kinase
MSNFLELSFKQEIYRKYIHLTSSVFGFSILLFPKEILIPAFVLCTVILFFVDIMRYRSKSVNYFFEYVFKGVMRPVEREQITGATYLLFGVLLTTLLFDKTAAATGMFFMSFSDTSAAIFGIGFGKTKIWKDKTLEGSFAFFITSIMVIILMPEIPLFVGIIAALIGTIVELFAVPKFNDNLLIPLITAFVISLGI